MKRGKLIVFEGGDASGKETQTRVLEARLAEEGYPVRRVSFPNYESASSALIKMYLSGEFGTDPTSVNPYAASLFYTVDRYSSYKKDWGDFYLEGGIIIADRYVTSNMIHQAAKINDPAARTSYLEWLWNLEFDLVGLPTPDMVFFLDVPPDVSRMLIKARSSKIGNTGKDIHEENRTHLDDVYRNALEIADRYNWIRVKCVPGGNLKSIDEIHAEVYAKITSILA